MIRPGAEAPWWLQDAPPDDPAPQLLGDVDARIAVVGGGFTGLWTALGVKEREPAAEVALLEADLCGLGPSGRNGGFLHGYWSSLAGLRDLVGDEAALALAHAGDRVIPAVRSLCERSGEDVWLREDGMLEVSTTPQQDASIEHTLAAARELGREREAVPLSGAELSMRCRSPRFRRGVLFRDGATVQPARLVRALRREAIRQGVRVYERSPVIRLRPGRPTVLETPGGSVRADEVVVAVNAAAAGWRPTARRLTVFGSYVVLTEPVPDLLEEIGWTGGEGIYDARMFLHYFRTTRDGRVLMGSGSGPIGHGGRLDGRFFLDAPSIARAEAGLRRLLPGLARARVEHAWGGPIDVSSDHLPFVGTVPGARIHYAAGYSGNGVGPSWLAAQALASLATGRGADEWTRLPLVTRRVPKLPSEPLKRLGGGLVRAAILACEEAEDEGRRPSLAARAGAALPRLFRLRVGTR